MSDLLESVDAQNDLELNELTPKRMDNKIFFDSYRGEDVDSPLTGQKEAKNENRIFFDQMNQLFNQH